MPRSESDVSLGDIQMKYIFIISALIILNLGEARANGIGISSISLAEKSREDLTIDGVTVKYGTGIQALKLSKNLNSNDNIYLYGGLGYHPSYDVSYLGSNFNGPVLGKAFGLGLTKTMFSRESYKIELETEFSVHSFESNKLKGAVRGQIAQVKSNGKMDSLSISSVFKKNTQKGIIFGARIGANYWNIKSLGVTYIDNLKITKRANGNNLDPIIGAFINFDFYEFNADFSYSLKKISADSTGYIDQIKLVIKF